VLEGAPEANGGQVWGPARQEEIFCKSLVYVCVSMWLSVGCVWLCVALGVSVGVCVSSFCSALSVIYFFCALCSPLSAVDNLALV
jgi:hypothetical protein